MQARAWTSFLRRVPQELHHSLMLVTSIGMEISIQDIICLNDDHLAVRGRLAGTTDSGRLFIVPFEQINYLGFQIAMNEALLRQLFGEECLLPVVPPEGLAPPTLPEETPTTTVVPEAPPEPAASVEVPQEGPPPETRLPIPPKAALLERLRARSRAAGTPSPPPAT